VDWNEHWAAGELYLPSGSLRGPVGCQKRDTDAHEGHGDGGYLPHAMEAYDVPRHRRGRRPYRFRLRPYVHLHNGSAACERHERGITLNPQCNRNHEARARAECGW
jgi:hypothetical protein